MVNIGKVRKAKQAKEQRKAEMEARRSGSGADVKWFSPPVGMNCIGILPDHPNQDGLPFIERGVHRNCGPDSDAQFNCVRNTVETSPDTCPQCKANIEDWTSKVPSRKERANRRSRRSRAYYNIINLRPLILDDKMPAIPKCFLDHPEEEDARAIKTLGCARCDWQPECQDGVQVGSFGTTIHDAILGEFDDIGDITKSDEFFPIKFKKTQENSKDPNTIRYNNVKALKNSIAIPQEVADRIDEKLNDLTTIGKPRTADEIIAIMDGVALGGAAADSDKPDCYGEYDEDRNTCQKCEVCEECEIETEGDDGKCNDDDDERSKLYNRLKDKKKPRATQNKQDDDDDDDIPF